jgi:hypothetical protein
MNISNIASEIVELVQQETFNKTNITKINRQVASIINKIVKNFSDAEEGEDYTVLINLQHGLPKSVYTNHPNLSNALFVCTDDVSVTDDEDNAAYIDDDTIVVGVGTVELQDDMSACNKAAQKFERDNE